MNVLIVMLIWAGNNTYGGPATIAGFDSVAACERAVPIVKPFYDGALNGMKFQCVELAR